MKKVLLLLLIALSVCTSVSAEDEYHYGFHDLLTDMNQNGQFLPNTSPEPVPPGTPTAVELIPKADQSMVGKKIKVQLSRNVPKQAFYYYYNSETHAESLVVIVPAKSIPLLVLCETDFGGTRNFVNAVESGKEFTATVLSLINISFEEGNVYSPNAAGNGYLVDEKEIISSSEEVTNPNKEEICIGVVGIQYDNTPVMFIQANLNETVSERLKGNFDVFHRIFERFGLTDDVTNPNTGDDSFATAAPLVVFSLVSIISFIVILKKKRASR